MALNPGDIILVSFPLSWEGQRYLSTWTYVVDTNSSAQDTPEDTLDIAQFFASGTSSPILNELSDCLGDDVDIGQVRAQPIHPVRQVYRTSPPDVTSGAFGSNAATGNVAGVVTMSTATAGRDQIANKHIGPLGATAYAAGAPVSGLLIALAALGLGARGGPGVPAGAGTIELEAVIFHRALGLFSPIIDARVSDRIGTMSRRTLRVGE